MNKNFVGKRVLVTGAAGNLGRAVAAAFAAEGAALVLVDAKMEFLDRAYPDAASGAKLAVDLTDRAAVLAAFEQAGAVDVLVAVTGGFHMGEAVHETPAEKWQLMVDLNLTTLLRAVEAVVPGMIGKGGGKIITIGAHAALRGLPTLGAYCATKSAVMRLTESMAAELGAKGINVNCVMPSILDTPQNRAAMPEADPGNWVPPGELASVILFLASDAAKSVHGALVPVTGLS